MSWVIFEVMLAFGLAVFIVWWTFPKQKKVPKSAPTIGGASAHKAGDIEGGNDAGTGVAEGAADGVGNGGGNGVGNTAAGASEHQKGHSG